MDVRDMLGNPIILGCKVALCVLTYKRSELRWGIAVDFDPESKTVIVKNGTCKRALYKRGNELIVIMMPVEEDKKII
ncbi:MAG: hypothetical protein AABY22_26910 [Nanoarchaeota archaeon]